MARWKYDLGEYGKALREAINEGGEDLASCALTLEKLIACYDRIKKWITDDDWVQDFDDLNEASKGMLEDIQSGDVCDDYALESVNEALAEFYDLCDAYRIWVAL